MGPGGRRTESFISPCHRRQKLPGIASGDIGKCAYAIFRRGREFLGKTVGIAGDHLTGGRMAAALTKALGQEVRYNAVSPRLPRIRIPGAEDLGNMFQFNRDFESIFCGPAASYFPGRSSLDADVRVLARGKRGRIPIEEVSCGRRESDPYVSLLKREATERAGHSME